MLLPELRNPAPTLVALSCQTELVIGAAAMTQTCRTQPLKGPGVAVEVIGPCRRRRIATSLLAGIENAARLAFAADALYAASRVDEGTAEMHGWQCLGFTVADTVEEHVLSIDEFEPRLGSLVDRMRAKGRIPPNAEIIPLYR